jgi:hypothetical protein
MAKRQRSDPTTRMKLDEFESRMLQLKIFYEKYFNGLDAKEPSRERDLLRQKMLLLTRTTVSNTAQSYRFQSLRARYSSLEQYLRRNLVMIERGTHPKFRFRADLADRARAGQQTAELPVTAGQRPRPQATADDNRAMRSVYDQFMEARRSCGQKTNVPFEQVERVLAEEVDRVKREQGCRGVRFKVMVEDGKAQVRALPVD